MMLEQFISRMIVSSPLVLMTLSDYDRQYLPDVVAFRAVEGARYY